MNKKIYRYLFFCLSFFITTIAFIIVSLITGNGIWGNNTVLKWDAISQYINFLGYFYDILKGNSKELFYSLSITPGGDTSLLWGYYLISPFNLISLFFDKSTLPDAYYWIECCKLSTASLNMGIFLLNYCERKRIRLDWTKSVLLLSFALAYSYGGFTAAYTHDTLWFDAILILPLLADGIFKLLFDKKTIQYFLCLAYGIVTNFYFGFMLCLFSLLLFTYLSIVHSNRDIRSYFRFGIVSILCAGATSFKLIPNVIQVFNSKLGDSEALFRMDHWIAEVIALVVIMSIVYVLCRFCSFKGWGGYALHTCIVFSFFLILHFFLNRFAWIGNYHREVIDMPFRLLIGVFDFYESGTADLMCIYPGILVVLIVLVYLFDYRCDNRKKIINIELIILCYFMMGFVNFNYVWHGFTSPAGNIYRWGYIIIFLLILISVDYLTEAVQFTGHISIKKLIGNQLNYKLVLSMGIIMIFAIHFYRQSGYQFITMFVIGVNACFCIVYIALFYFMKKNKSLSFVIAFLLFCEITINAVLSQNGFEYASNARYASYIELSGKIMEDIQTQKDEDLYRVESEYEPNWYYISGYNTIFHYSSAFERANHYFLDKFGMAGDFSIFGGERAQNNFELSPYLTGFLGIRYLVSGEQLPFDEYKLLNSYIDDYEGKNYYLYKNLSALPIAFAIDNSVVNMDYNAVDTYSLEDIARESKSGLSSGLIQVDSSEYKCKVNCSDGDVIVVTLPMNEWWEAYIDGNKIQLNRAFNFFIAIDAGEGEHNITLRYNNKILLYSAILSVLFLVIYILFKKKVENQND